MSGISGRTRVPESNYNQRGTASTEERASHSQKNRSSTECVPTLTTSSGGNLLPPSRHYTRTRPPHQTVTVTANRYGLPGQVKSSYPLRSHADRIRVGVSSAQDRTHQVLENKVTPSVVQGERKRSSGANRLPAGPQSKGSNRDSLLSSFGLSTCTGGSANIDPKVNNQPDTIPRQLSLYWY